MALCCLWSVPSHSETCLAFVWNCPWSGCSHPATCLACVQAGLGCGLWPCAESRRRLTLAQSANLLGRLQLRLANLEEMSRPQSMTVNSPELLQFLLDQKLQDHCYVGLIAANYLGSDWPDRTLLLRAVVRIHRTLVNSFGIRDPIRRHMNPVTYISLMCVSMPRKSRLQKWLQPLTFLDQNAGARQET